MQPLRSVLLALADRPDVAGAVVVSDDGLMVESSLAAGLDGEELAALAADAGRGLAALGRAARAGQFVQAAVECRAGTLVLQQLRSGATLVVLAAEGSDLGGLLYDLRRHAPALVALL